MSVPRSPLFWQVYERLVSADVEARAAQLIEAAFESDAALVEALVATSEVTATVPAKPPAAQRPAPVRTWLTRVEVTGFRGIGPTVTLDLAPGPGLTLIVGRNGSGKSSLAEALEVVLTGDNRRWAGRAKEWRDGWRNLHHPGESRVAATFATEGSRPTDIVRHWSADAEDIAAATVEVVRDGKRVGDFDGLGWKDALVTHRPMLSYAELGRLIDDGPSKLFDSLEAILGLDELAGVRERLATERKRREKLTKEVKDALPSLLARLRALDDPRAVANVASLSGKKWDLDAVAATLATGSAADPALGLLQRLAVLEGPDLDALGAAVKRLREAVAAQTELTASLAGSLAARQRATAELLENALGWHAGHGDDDCPVCGAGRIDAAWRERTASALKSLRDEARAVDGAAQGTDAAVREARSLVTSPPGVLREAEARSLGGELGALSETAAAWRAFVGAGVGAGVGLGAPVGVASALPAIALAAHLAAHLEEQGPRLVAAIESLRTEASARVNVAEGRWQPVAHELALWHARAVLARAAAEPVRALKAAEEWLKDAEAALRSERFEPIKARAQAIWTLLRQESHVELANIALEGDRTRRRVDIDVTIDGSDAGALGVMSQGEINALALSLFIPRLTHVDSPFHFVVIDDPVQAMDPFKVDGLARVLSETAQDRQVIVLTHDTRLEEAVRRMQIPATVLEVARRACSVLEVRRALAPIQQYLDDARSLVKSTREVGPEVIARVVPALCRSAVEAALTEAVRRRRLTRGDRHEDVSEALRDARTTMQLAALALFDDAERGGDVFAHLNRRFGGWAADTLRAVKEGAHGELRMDAETLIRESFSLANHLRSAA